MTSLPLSSAHRLFVINQLYHPSRIQHTDKRKNAADSPPVIPPRQYAVGNNGKRARRSKRLLAGYRLRSLATAVSA